MTTNLKEQEELFKLIGSKLKNRLEAFIIGGASMLYYNAKNVTKDIDIVFRGMEDLFHRWTVEDQAQG